MFHPYINLNVCVSIKRHKYIDVNNIIDNNRLKHLKVKLKSWEKEFQAKYGVQPTQVVTYMRICLKYFVACKCSTGYMKKATLTSSCFVYQFLFNFILFHYIRLQILLGHTLFSYGAYTQGVLVTHLSTYVG